MFRFSPAFCFLIIHFSTQVVAQNSEVVGAVYDRESGDVLAFTNVTLLHNTDSSLVAGGTTTLEGSFSFDAPPGEYLLKISFIGYRDYFQRVNVVEGKPLRLGDLEVRPDAQALAVVEVQALQSSFRNDIDKRVFNVENSITAAGGTAIDVLETLPSIQIDEEGSVTMRGSGQVLIYINGRPTNMSGDDSESILAQFPASSIKDIELITNPSSRYDAAGVGGIINIILKKDEKRGFNGQTNLSVGTRHKYTTGVNLNYGTGKFNFFGTYNFQYRERFRNQETFRESFDGLSSRFLDLRMNSTNTDRSHLARGGFDVQLSESITFGTYLQANIQNGSRDRLYNQLFRSVEETTDSLIVRYMIEDAFEVNYEGGMTFDWDLREKGKIMASASLAIEDEDEVEYYDQFLYNSNISETPQERLLQTFDTPSLDYLIQAQIDYTRSLSENLGLEIGVKSTTSLETRSQILTESASVDAEGTVNQFVSDSVGFDQYINAAYFILAGKVNRFGYQAGLRGEHTMNEINTYDESTAISNDYFNLFPSAYITYDLTERSKLLVNYSRRINRPRIWDLSPLLNIQDPTNQRTGNPNLRPEFTDSYELGYSREAVGYFFTGTLYHRRTTDLITRIFVPQENNVNVMIRENAAIDLSTGLELINQFEFSNWFDATLTGNLFHSQIKGETQGRDYDNSNFTWNVSLLSNFKVGRIGTFQMQGNYRGPMVRPQGIIKPMYGINMGFRKNILRRKGTISFNVTDVFDTREFIVSIADPTFTQDRRFKWESRVATISFTYNFGSFNRRGDQDVPGGNGMMDDGF